MPDVYEGMTYDLNHGFFEGWLEHDDAHLEVWVRRAHEHAGASMGENALGHCLFHVVAERQIVVMPEAAGALQRLVAGGLGRHDAVHLIANENALMLREQHQDALEGDPDVALAARLSRLTVDHALPDDGWDDAAIFSLTEAEWDEFPLGSVADEPSHDASSQDDASLDAPPELGGEASGWLTRLLFGLANSPEAAEVNVAGWAHVFAESYLLEGHDIRLIEPHEVAQALDKALFWTDARADDVPAIVAEVRAFFRYCARRFGMATGAACAASLESALTIPRLTKSMNDKPDLEALGGALTALGSEVNPADPEAFAGILAALGVDTLSDPEPAQQIPFPGAAAEIDGDAPCPCGSGETYARCCLR